jgi:hypothetical protein
MSTTYPYGHVPSIHDKYSRANRARNKARVKKVMENYHKWKLIEVLERQKIIPSHGLMKFRYHKN